MATQKHKVEYINIGISVRIVDPSSTPEDRKTVDIVDNVGLNLSDEKHMDELLTEKPYLGEIIPVIVEALTKKYDPAAAKAKAFAEKMKKIVDIGQ